MPGPKITAELLLTTDMKDAVREIDKGLSGAVRQHAKEVKKTVGAAWRDAVELAMGDGKTGRAMKDFIRAGVVEAAETYSVLMKKERVVEAQAQKELLEKRAKAFRREVDLRRQAFREMQDRQVRTAEEAADQLKGGAQKFASILRGDIGGLTDVVRSGGRGLQTRGRAHQHRASEVLAAGGDPQQAAQMANLGKNLAGVGKALAGIAAMAGAVIVLVKLFADLESKAKDMNKTLLESAGAADFGFSGAEIRAGALRRQLEILRDETTSLNENFLKFRVGSQEQQQILATLNAAGMTYARMNEEIKQGSKFMRSFSDATALAVTYSRILGVDTREIAQRMGDFSLETGMGLEEVAGSFSVIQREALAAGFHTKRFYSTVMEATSGMNFYGVRIEETSKLLKTFDSLLGEVAGPDAFKELVGQFKDKSAQDRLKDFIVKDGEFVTQQFQNAFERRMSALNRQFGDQLAKQGTSLEELLAGATSNVDLRSKLGSLGIRGQQATDISHLRRLQQAASGNRAAQISAAGTAGPGFDVAMAIKTAIPLERYGKTLGQAIEQAIREGNEGAVIALENLEQRSGLSKDRILELADAASGQLNELQRIRDTNGEVPKDLEKLGFFIDKQTGEIKRGIADTSGVITAEGKKNAAVIHDEFDLLASQPSEDAEQIKEALSKDQQIASEISRNITGLNDIMSQSVTAILNDIYSVLVSIADFLFKDDPDRNAALHFQEKMANESQTTNERLKKLSDEETRLLGMRERGEELSKDQKERLAALPDLIAGATTQSEISQSAAELAKDMEGSDVRKFGFSEARRRLRVRAGDAEAASPLAWAQAQQDRARASRFSEVSPEAEEPGWARGLRNIGGFLTPGSGTQALVDRALGESGISQSLANFGARAGRAVGVGRYAGMSDEEIAAIENAVATGTERAYEDRSVFKDAFGIGLTSAKITRQESVNREVEASLMKRDAQQDQMTDTMESGFEEVKKAVETSGVLGFLNNLRKAQDVIIPSEGSPILTDRRDTIFAGKPGGPIADALGSMGGRGPVNVNIYGGDTRKIYETVIRAMKATGNA